MKAITVWAPWSSLIAISAKPYEFRKWAVPKAIVGQRIAIHAGVRKVRPAEVRALIIALRARDPSRAALRAEIALPFLERLLLATVPQGFAAPTRVELTKTFLEAQARLKAAVAAPPIDPPTATD